MKKQSLNFNFLSVHDPLLDELGASAEKTLYIDANSCLMTLRQFGELLARKIAMDAKVPIDQNTNNYEILKQLEKIAISFNARKLLEKNKNLSVSKNDIPKSAVDLLHKIRRRGNDASHNFRGDEFLAKENLEHAYELARWYHICFHENWDADVPPFSLPTSPVILSEELTLLKRKYKGKLNEKLIQNEVIKQLKTEIERKQNKFERLNSEFNKVKDSLSEVTHECDTYSYALKIFFKEIQNTGEYKKWADSLGERPGMQETLSWLLSENKSVDESDPEHMREACHEPIKNDCEQLVSNDAVSTKDDEIGMVARLFLLLSFFGGIIWLIVLNK